MSDADVVAMQLHLSECDECARRDTALRRGLLVFRNLTPVELSAAGVYTLSFLIFWGVAALGASLALLLVNLPADEARPQHHSPGWPR